MSHIHHRHLLNPVFLILIAIFFSLLVGVIRMPNGEARSTAGSFALLQNPPATTLSDDFNDNSLDTTKWNADNLFSGFTDLNLPVAETSQRPESGPLFQNTSGSHYRGIRSVNTYEFAGAYSYVELVQPASAATAADAMFTVGTNVEAYYRISVSAGTLYGVRKSNGVKTTLFSIPYSVVIGVCSVRTTPQL